MVLGLAGDLDGSPDRAEHASGAVAVAIEVQAEIFQVSLDTPFGSK